MAFFLILAPFATFATLMTLATAKIALAASAAVGLVVFAIDLWRGRTIKALNTGATIVFAALFGYHLIAAAEMHPIAVRIAVDAGVLAIALASIAIRYPFTLQYALEQTDAETQSKPQFSQVNYTLTWVWSGAFAAMIVADIVAIYLPNTLLWTCAAIAFVARQAAMYFTQWYPKHVTAHATANAAA